MRRTSSAGLAFIAGEEGLVLHPYADSRGFATIFVGHLIREGPIRVGDAQAFAPLTREHAIKVLRKDAHLAELAVNGCLPGVDLSQGEFDMLVSLAFNIGVGAFAKSTVVRMLRAGDYRAAADAFLMWRIGGAGLIFRRRRERARFLEAHAKARDPLAVLTRPERAWVDEYDRILKSRARGAAARRHELRAKMKRRRKAIWAIAQPASKGGDGKGWHFNHRGARHTILKDRTRGT